VREQPGKSLTKTLAITAALSAWAPGFAPSNGGGPTQLGRPRYGAGPVTLTLDSGATTTVERLHIRSVSGGPRGSIVRMRDGDTLSVRDTPQQIGGAA
jgi:hypothetical protein